MNDNNIFFYFIGVRHTRELTHRAQDVLDRASS